MGLQSYWEKRDFKKTAEPRGKKKATRTGHSFVIQKHDASHLHYDFRLELDGVLKSWAVPKGPSLDPTQKRLAMEVEDHPIDYADFEGEIPKGEYGGGEVIVWDQGTWEPKGDPHQGLSKGRLEFSLKGTKLHGAWILVRTRPSGSRSQWLLMKRPDEAAITEAKYDVTSETESVISGRLLGRDAGVGKKNSVQAALGAKKNSKYGRKIEASASVTKRAPKGKVVAKGKAPATGKKASSKKAVAASITEVDEDRRFGQLDFVEPQLAQLVTEPPVGENWVHEIKFDGYRTLCHVSKKERTAFYSRKGLDWTEKYTALIREVERLPAKSMLLDGEIVAQDERGRSDFLRLQGALKAGRSEDLAYYVFDLLELDGEDLRPLPLSDRKARLKAVFDELPESARPTHVLYSDHFSGVGMPILQKGCVLGLEGIISKDLTQPYVSGRAGGWVKSKCITGQEFVVAGYTPPAGSRVGFGAVLLGAYEPDGKFRYVGKVGTGFERKELLSLLRKFGKLETRESPFGKKVPGEKKVIWLKPKLVVDIQFRGWTADGLIRQGAYHGLRVDKPANEVTVDRPVPVEAVIEKRAQGADVEIAGVKLTHPERVLIPETKLTKKDLRDYLHAVHERMLPHVVDRPLALMRCPEGVDGECFFQKHLPQVKNSPHVSTQAIQDPKGKAGKILYIESEAGLMTLAQMGAIELHVWGAHRGKHLNPDLVVFDLDPDTGVSQKQIVATALRIREILKSLELESFLKVSGGKGHHIHVPIEPRYTWEDVRRFSQAIAQQLVEENPELYLAVMTKAKRKGKIFIDYLRNGYGATSVAPYSVRARKEGTVALPIAWEDAPKVKPNQFTVKKALDYLKKQKQDPWKEYFQTKQRIGILEAQH